MFLPACVSVAIGGVGDEVVCEGSGHLDEAAVVFVLTDGVRQLESLGLTAEKLEFSGFKECPVRGGGRWALDQFVPGSCDGLCR